MRLIYVLFLFNYFIYVFIFFIYFVCYFYHDFTVIIMKFLHASQLNSARTA